jgi:putative membrane protein
MKIMKFKILPIGVLALATFTQACNSNKKQDTADTTMSAHTMVQDSAAHDTTNNMKNGTPVNRFLEQAAIGGQVEVEMGKIGQQKASMKRIREFAAMIEKDHTAANLQLSTLASAKGFKLPSQLSPLKREHLNDLKRASGKDFDNYYINMMVEDHISDISLYEGATKSPDTAVSAFAAKILPVLQKHYKQAREISMLFDQNKNRK